MKNIKLGIVLSGGRTKGVAYVGVLEFLKEKNIEPEILDEIFKVGYEAASESFDVYLWS